VPPGRPIRLAGATRADGQHGRHEPQAISGHMEIRRPSRKLACRFAKRWSVILDWAYQENGIAIHQLSAAARAG